MENITVSSVLTEAEKLLSSISERKSRVPKLSNGRPLYTVTPYRVQDVWKRLSIFDWFKETLSESNLKDMRTFLKEAVKLGYTGYVCFKVGATGYANGMWAYKELSKDGYSPDGDFLYRSFTPEYTYWALHIDGVNYPSGEKFDSVSTIRDLEKLFHEKNDPRLA